MSSVESIPDKLGGLPCIAGTRIPVATILATLADGGIETVLKEWPSLTAEDVKAALRWAAGVADSPSVVHCGECQEWDADLYGEHGGCELIAYVEEWDGRPAGKLAYISRDGEDNTRVITHRTFGCVQGVRK